VRTWGSARVEAEPCRDRLGLQPESGSRSGTTPTGGPRLSARERREEERGVGWADWAGGGGEQAGPAGLRGEEREERRKAGVTFR
jgi:hypothetical protein